jgi:hypothetical protein
VLLRLGDGGMHVVLLHQHAGQQHQIGPGPVFSETVSMLRSRSRNCQSCGRMAATVIRPSGGIIARLLISSSAFSNDQ